MKRSLIILLAITALAPAYAAENLALNCRYTLSPAPGYHLCTDPGDRTQLTDGVYTEGYFWTRSTTVGWQGAPVAAITIDLGGSQPISGLSFNTAAGTAGVEWPTSILVLASNDNRNWYYEGDLIELSAVENSQPAPRPYSIHRFSTTKLATCARYVKVLAFSNGPYLFVDEIEIHRGPAGLLSSTAKGRPVDDITDFQNSMAITRGLRRRLRLDLAAVEKLAEDSDQTSKWQSRLDELQRSINALRFTPPPDFRTVFPICDLHAEVFEIQAAIWRSRSLPELSVWHTNRWDMLSPARPPETADFRLDVEMMRNEHRAAAFNLTSAAAAQTTVSFTIEGLPHCPNPPYLTAFEIPFTDTRAGVPVAAAMPQLSADPGYNVTITPGLTKQIWLSFDSKGLQPGDYHGAVVINPGPHRIPLNLTIHPIDFPDRPTLHLGGWDYTDQPARYQVTPQNRKAFIARLREYFVDAPWATSGVLSRGRYDAEGNMTAEPDPGQFRAWLDRWPDARIYCVFASVGDSFQGFEQATPEFENAVGNWMKWWSDRLTGWNISPDRLAVLLVDEPHSLDQDDTIIAYASAIRKAAPKVRIFNDPTWSRPWDARAALFELSDILCPNLPMLIARGQRFADFYDSRRDAGAELWFYSCSGPGRLLDPYSYHRLQHWFCFKHGAAGSAFWAFGDSNGSSSWNEYLALRGAYTPLFIDENTVTTGKHMEAIREGVEDCEYLIMLRQRLAQLRKQGRSAALLTEAEKLLAEAPDRVTAEQSPESLQWQTPKDRSIADETRIQILRTLTKLKDL